MPLARAAATSIWLLAYLGTGAAGTSSGVLLNTQQPALPFSASHVIRWRLDGFVQDVQAWNGSAWVTAPIGSSLAPSGNFVEVAVMLSALGSPSTLQFASYLLSDQTGFEASYAAVPGSAFVDGYDPQVGAYLTFATPEPSTALLVGLGLGLVAARVRRPGPQAWRAAR